MQNINNASNNNNYCTRTCDSLSRCRHAAPSFRHTHLYPTHQPITPHPHTFHPRWRSFIESSTASHLRSSILKLARALLTLSLALPVPLSYCAVQSLERERAVYFLSINSWNRVSATNSMQNTFIKRKGDGEKEREKQMKVTEFELDRCEPGSPLTSDAATRKDVVSKKM